MNLPELQGTEKQIEWASKIRRNSIEKIQAVVDERSQDPPEDRRDDFKAVLKEFISYLIYIHTDASWWIEQRKGWTSSDYTKHGAYNSIDIDYLLMEIGQQHIKKYREIVTSHGF